MLMLVAMLLAAPAEVQPVRSGHDNELHRLPDILDMPGSITPVLQQHCSTHMAGLLALADLAYLAGSTCQGTAYAQSLYQ